MAVVVAVALGADGAAASGAAAAAQLRPLEPFRWEALGRAGAWEAELGASVLADERASLAGAEGRLWEAGTFALTRGFGRAAVRITGTAHRVFEPASVFAAPVDGGRAPDGSSMTDVGDLRVETLVRLVRRGPLDVGLRFGTRLPTTDEAAGMERDRTDFWASAGVSWAPGGGVSDGEGAGTDPRGSEPWRGLRVEADAGVAVLQTRQESPEQIDPMFGSVRIRRAGGPVEPWVAWVWQRDLRRAPNLRGLENQGELRAGVRVGRTWSLRVEGVVGLEPFDPEWGLGLSVARSW